MSSPPGAHLWTAGLAASPASPAHEGCSARDRQGSRSAALRTENCTNLPETTRPEAAETPDPGPELQDGGEFRFQRFVPRSVSPREEQTLNGLGDQKAQKPKRPSVNGERKQGSPSTKRRRAAEDRGAPTRAGPGEPRPLTSWRGSGRPTRSAPAATAARPGPANAPKARSGSLQTEGVHRVWILARLFESATRADYALTCQTPPKRQRLPGRSRCRLGPVGGPALGPRPGHH